MYGDFIRASILLSSQRALTNGSQVSLAEQSLRAFAGALARAAGAQISPTPDLLQLTLQILILSHGLSLADASDGIERLHYLAALGLEQTGALIARMHQGKGTYLEQPVENNDDWYRLILATLHYLAGGYRVQAYSTFRQLETMADSAQNGVRASYLSQISRLRNLLTGDLLELQDNNSASIFPGNSFAASRFNRLAQQARLLQVTRINALGYRNESSWLAGRVENADYGFWRRYLNRLVDRGITAFTEDQVGDGFDTWLRSGVDVIAILPTGSGKTVIGELKTALALASGGQALWLLPTRALVRQTKRYLRDAFRVLDVRVEELPVTEDYIPLFEASINQEPLISVTTPEKLAALLRVKPEAADSIRTVVLDEAQVLLEPGRGATAEEVLLELTQHVASIDLVFLCAFSGAQKALDKLQSGLHPYRSKPSEVVNLLSVNCPTRRIYGLTTSDAEGKLKLAIYPPGAEVQGVDYDPIVIDFAGSVSKPDSSLEIGRSLLKALDRTVLRTAMFVNTKVSANKAALQLAKKTQKIVSLPDNDLARLSVELGRGSIVAEFGVKGVACHHASLTPLEQHLVEKWLRKGIVYTVVATPTLAQGVNLPLDIVIVSQLTRAGKAQEQIPIADIQNMLGRSGRIGFTSDGIGVIAVKQSSQSLQDKLNAGRGYFFSAVKSMKQAGLAKLLTTVRQLNVADKNWLVDLDETSFTSSQAIVSFALREYERTGSLDTNLLLQRISSFPSSAEFSQKALIETTYKLMALTKNLIDATNGDQVLLSCLRKTGLPIQFLRICVDHVRNQAELPDTNLGEITQWADNVILNALTVCEERHWLTKLVENRNIHKLYDLVLRWRNGDALALIEKLWPDRGTTRLMKCGEFLNHNLSLFAQLWGGLAVCYAEVYGESNAPIWQRLKILPTLTREGVSDSIGLAWLHAIGGIDRVLANVLAKTDFLLIDQPGSNTRDAILHLARDWKGKAQSIPKSLSEIHSKALVGALADEYTE